MSSRRVDAGLWFVILLSAVVVRAQAQQSQPLAAEPEVLGVNSSSEAGASVPRLIKFSGNLKDRMGKPLTGPYKGLWKYRIGDYRIIYAIEDKRLVVFVLRIRHRKDVYHGIAY